MKRALGVTVVGTALVLCGCADPSRPAASSSVQTLTNVPGSGAGGSTASASAAPINTATPADDRIIARVNGEPITMRQLVKPLLEAHGLTFLLNMARLDLVRQDARTDGVTVSPADIQREQDLTLDKMFKDADQKEQDQLDDAERKGQTERAAQLREQIRKDRQAFLQQYLQEKNYSRPEYDLVVEINAYLRKMSERLVQGKITEKLVEDEFGIEYGETAQVRYIQLANMQEVSQARRRLAAGDKFEDVAREMSRNARTAALGGELPAFSRQTPGLSQTFKDAAFALQPGQVSDTLNLGGNYYLVKLEQKFPPKAVKFENVKDSLRKSMTNRVVEATMDSLRNGLNQQALTRVRVDDPMLSKQFEDVKAQREAAIRDKVKIEEELRKERLLRGTTQPTTEPSLAPTTSPTTQP